MLKPQSYVDYLETVVLSLINRQADRQADKDITIDDPDCNAWAKDCTLSPYNVRKEINTQRKSRN